MKALKYTPVEIDVNVTDISLLTVEEAKTLPEDIGRYGQRWWLRSPGRGHHDADYVYYDGLDAAYVYYDGSVDSIGDYVGYTNYAVRPAVTISGVKFEIGDTVTMQDKKYVAIAPDRLLYNDKTVYHRFGKSTNDYDKSEIKKVVDGWLEEEEGEE